jgi:hypothetical protein
MMAKCGWRPTAQQLLPGPLDGGVQGGVGEQGEVVGDLLDGDQAFDVAHQGAEDLGVVGASQGVHQRFFVGLAGAHPGAVPLGEVLHVRLRIKPALQQARVSQLVDDAGVAQQVAHGPLGGTQQAQQSAQHFLPFSQHGQVAVAA